MPTLRSIQDGPLVNKTFIKNDRYGFDEDGFSKANNDALLAAKQQMQEKAKSLWQDMVDINNYKGAYSQTMDGRDTSLDEFTEFQATGASF